MATVNLQDDHILVGDTLQLVSKHNNALDEIEAAINTNDSIDQGLGNRVAILEADGVPANVTIPAISTIYNLANIQAVDVYTGEDSNGWELRANLPYNNETVPTGVYVGQFATVALAVAGGGSVEDHYYNTTDTYFYKITDAGSGTEAGSRIYRAGSRHLPLVRAAAVSGTGGSTRVLIFDLTNGECSMWMEFAPNSGGPIFQSSSVSISCVLWAGQKLYVGRTASHGLSEINFGNNKSVAVWRAAANYKYNFTLGIEDRNSVGNIYNVEGSSAALPSDIVNSLAAYTAPNAPTDQITGMPIPYILGATDGGCFAILPDGTVYNSSDTIDFGNILAIGDRLWALDTNLTMTVYDFGRIETLVDSFVKVDFFYGPTTPGLTALDYTNIYECDRSVIVTHASGIDLLLHNQNTPANSMIAKIGTDFNTGWMVKPLSAAICDTATGSIADTELISNATYNSNTRVSSYTYTSGDTAISMTWDGVGADGLVRINLLGLTDGRLYKLTTQGDNTFTEFNEVYSNQVRNGSDVIQDQLSAAEQGTTNVNSLYFISSGSEDLLVYSRYAGSLTYTITLQEVIPDRSQILADGNHLDVVGTLTRTAIETGGVAAISGFTSSTNYATSDSADFDIDGVAHTIKLAFKINTVATSGAMLGTGEEVTGKRRAIVMNSSGTVSYSNNGAAVTSAGEYDDNNWHTLSARMAADGSGVLIDIDGVLVASGDLSGSNAAYTFSAFTVGALSTGGTAFVGGSIICLTPENVYETDASIEMWHHDTMRMIESGTATLANTIDAAHHDERQGVTRLLDSDDNELLLNGLVIESSRDLTASDTTDVGAVADISASGRARVIGGSTDLLIEVDSQNLREADTKLVKERFTVKYTGDSSRVQFPLQATSAEVAAVAGAKPIRVVDNGSELTEGASDDWEVSFDGFNYWATLAVAPGANDVLVEFEREVYR